MTCALKPVRAGTLLWFAFISFGMLSTVMLSAWCISYWRGIEIGYGWKNGNWIDFGNYFGFCRVMIGNPRTDRPPRRFEIGSGFGYIVSPASILNTIPGYRPRTYLGFSYVDAFPNIARNPRVQTWWFPDWFVVLLVLPPTVLLGHRLMVERRSKRRLAAGLCHACGYDLRGAVVSESSSRRCPECGVVSSIPSNASAS